MTETDADVLARRLSSCIDDLARALDRAGTPVSESMRLLELSAVAAAHAVGLAESAAARETATAGSAMTSLRLPLAA